MKDLGVAFDSELSFAFPVRHFPVLQIPVLQIQLSHRFYHFNFGVSGS